MSFSDHELIDGVLARDARSLARMITLVEDRAERARRLYELLFPRTGRAHIIGITGSPGAGKSTLVDQIGQIWRARGKDVAIVAVDPTSPYSGGAVLGDRIRMNKTCEDANIFVRSMATRGALGGLSRATLDTVHILDAAGFDVILLETVGVGQGEVDIVKTAHSCLVVMVPGMGDGVQSIKAGILEIADLFLINKADRDGADQLHKDLRVLLSLQTPAAGDWVPPIVRTIATTGEGCAEVVESCEGHFNWLQQTSAGEVRRRALVREAIIKRATDSVLEKLFSEKQALLEQLTERCFRKEISPAAAVEALLR